MNDETLNISIRKFLKMVGVKSQHEIEQAVSRACSQGTLQGSEKLAATMVLRMPQIGLEVVYDGRIELE
jgi:hypothetical protein